MEYADGGSLRNYLKENFNNLTWENKYDLAYQLACAVSCLHGEAIVHRDLHSGNVLVHQNKIKIADFGLSKRIEESSQKKYLFGIIPYIDPKKFAISNGNPYSLNEKSDIYSVGVLLWEISSGQLPFKDVDYDICLVLRIFKDQREKSVEDTPDEYVKLYTECWDGEPDNRPSINDVVQRLRANLSRSRMEIDNLKPNDNMDLNCIKNSAHGGLSRIIQDLEKINTSENIPTSKKKLVDEIVEFIFKEIDEEKNQETRERHILDNFNNNNTEIYNWLLTNQNEPNFIFLLGYFQYYGIETDENKKEAFNLFKNASEKNHILAQYYVGLCYEFGNGVVKNDKLAFDSFKKIADKEYALGQFKVGYFYYKEIGIKKNLKEAFTWYEKAAQNGNLIAMCNLGLMYKNGEGTNKDIDKAIYWYKESVEKGNQDAQKTLNKLLKIKNRKNLCKVN
ncbi:kinase-like protein [Rhizophagus irregularis]|uniref:Kinase-like protein n=1 Tax=Rhizophagus irregularis TaxID=588596 RepID=A0A2N1N7J0_9GLOM|nr:kinase-like protein [Rhizophagus irregularis]